MGYDDSFIRGFISFVVAAALRPVRLCAHFHVPRVSMRHKRLLPSSARLKLFAWRPPREKRNYFVLAVAVPVVTVPQRASRSVDYL